MDNKSNDSHSLLIVILDGWKKSTFVDLLTKGLLEGISKIIRDGTLLETIVSNLPSVSLASHLSIVTGQYINQHKIPGHRWFDRKRKRVRTYFSLDVSRKIAKDSNPSVKTVFESRAYDKSVSLQGIVNRGALKRIFYPTMSGRKLLKKTAKILSQDEKQVVVTWLPKVDSLSHKFGPESSQVKKEMIETAKGFQELERYLRLYGKYDSTDFLLLPDHGQRTISKSANLRRIFKLIGIPALVNPKLYHRHYQLIFTSGDSFAQVYLTGEHISKRNDIARQLCMFDEIELVCWRNNQGGWNIHSHDGYATAEWTNKENLDMSYRIVYGNDPLYLLKDGKKECVFNLSKPMTETFYPDFLHQVTHSYVQDRSGDMILFPSRDYHFGKAPRIGFRLGFHRGTHGGPFLDEMIVSGIVKGVQIDNQPVRMADILNRFI